MSVRMRVSLLAVVSVVLTSFAASGCGGTLFINQTQDVDGNLNIQFVNNTTARAIFTFGTFDDLDRSPGPVQFSQLRVEAGTSTNVTSLTCARDMAVATQKLADRIIDTNSDEQDNFDPDAFDTVVRFSSAPLGSSAEDLPTAGTAEGVRLLLGVHYTCNDAVIVTFNEDPNAPGGFAIAVQVIPDAL
jgi:hypothetical protein